MQVVDGACRCKAGEVEPGRTVDVIDITAKEKLNPGVPIVVVELAEIARKLFQGIAASARIVGDKMSLDGEEDRALDLFGGQFVQNTGGVQSFDPTQGGGRSRTGTAVTIPSRGLSQGGLAAQYKGDASQEQGA